MRGAYSTSFDSENDFVIDSHILAELRKQLKSKMRLKTASANKRSELRTNAKTRRANTIALKKSKNISHSLPWSSSKYSIRREGARKYCQWATYLKEKGEECLKEFIEK